MKKSRLFLPLLLALTLCLPPAGRGEIVGRTQDTNIHRISAPNGQTLYFTSTMEEPFIEYADVNFDGVEDLTVVTILGASNAWYEFFIREGDTYVWAEHDMPLINYSLDERGYVLSWGNNGMAGALFEAAILRWEGSRLATVRTMVSQEDAVWEWEENACVTTTYLDRYRVTLRDEGEEPHWEKTFAAGDAETTMFDEIQEELWKGL